MSNQTESDNRILEILYNIFKEQDEMTTDNAADFSKNLKKELKEILDFLKENIDDISPALKEELPDVFLKIKSFCSSAEVSQGQTIIGYITEILKHF